MLSTDRGSKRPALGDAEGAAQEARAEQLRRDDDQADAERADEQADPEARGHVDQRRLEGDRGRSDGEPGDRTRTPSTYDAGDALNLAQP